MRLNGEPILYSIGKTYYARNLTRRFDCKRNSPCLSGCTVRAGDGFPMSEENHWIGPVAGSRMNRPAC